MTEKDIMALIEKDEWMMSVLRVARDLNLPDWMIGAGFVRNKVWDYLHGFDNKEVQTRDIDLIYFDRNKLTEETEKKYEDALKEKLNINWEPRNQARMHIKHNRKELYKNSYEALSEWPETATCVAVRLNGDDTLELFVPHGTEDLVNLIVRPSPAFLNNLDAYRKRIHSKNWQEKWPKLKILES